MFPRLASIVLCVGESNLDLLNVGIPGIHALPNLLCFLLALESRVPFVTTKMVLAQRAGHGYLELLLLVSRPEGAAVFRLMKSL